VTIRPLAPDEVDRVVAAGLGLARLDAGTGFYLVAWDGDEPLGHAHLALHDPPELQDVSVLPQHRRRGVASALTRAAEREARARGAARLTLEVSERGEEAQALYRKLGYADDGTPPRRVQGTIQVRTGPLEVDDTLLRWERLLRPPALLLHGGPGFQDYTQPLADELAPLFEVDGYTQGRHLAIEAYVEEALARLAEPSWIVGHSFGGYLALQVTVAAPERVLGLVLVGSVGGVGTGGRKEAIPRLMARLSKPPESFEDIWPAYFAGEPAPFPGLVLDAEQNAATTQDMDERAERGDLERALPSLDKPALFVHGTYDHIPLEAVEETVAALPDATLVVLDGVGHFPWLERPGSVLDAIAAWGRVDSSR
jgi:proline iminopeptidase